MLNDLRRRVPDFDLLVLTGDTAHDEARPTYAAGDALTEWSNRVRIIPGNHDQRAFLRELFPQSTTGPADRITFQHAFEDWQIVGLDSHKPGEVPGRLGPEQLDWLQQCLAASSVPTMLCLHHPPIPVHSPWLDQIGLEDAAEFGELMRQHAHVRLIVTGHVHQEFAGSLGAATVLTTAAVGPQFVPRTEQLVIDDAPPAYRIIELESDGRWSTHVLRLPASAASAR
ncbi:MAG: metallophosphoesterase [Planctomycetaceae bacterium]